MTTEDWTMAKRPTNRIKFKLWHAEGSMEYDGSIGDGLYYGAWQLSIAGRQILINKLVEQQKKASETSTSATSA
jgi:hypothetical protein